MVPATCCIIWARWILLKRRSNSVRHAQRYAQIETSVSTFGCSESLALLSAGFIVMSQTKAFVWDEGFHLVAAQLINGGKRPYIDFCFPQTPLNAYWNAGLMRVFGQSWQVVHLGAALFTAGAVALTADYVFTRFPVARWRLACAIVAALFVGTSTIVIEFCFVGQAYGVSLFLIVAAFRVAVLTVRRRNLFLPFAVGLLAGAAADSSLLTSPVLPVLLLWMMFYDEGGNRWSKGFGVCCRRGHFLRAGVLAVRGSATPDIFQCRRISITLPACELEGRNSP